MLLWKKNLNLVLFQNIRLFSVFYSRFTKLLIFAFIFHEFLFILNNLKTVTDKTRFLWCFMIHMVSQGTFFHLAYNFKCSLYSLDTYTLVLRYCENYLINDRNTTNRKISETKRKYNRKNIINIIYIKNNIDPYNGKVFIRTFF